MHVVFRRVRQFVIDDVGQVIDIKAAGGDVGGDQGVGLAALKASSALMRSSWLLSPWMASP